jgi:hypothetical protein
MQPIPKEQGEQPDHTYKLIKRIALDNTTPDTPIQKEGHTHRSCRQMLASTMQISNNNPTNPLNPTREPQAKEDQNNHPAPQHDQLEPGAADSSGPNSVLDPIPHQREAMSNPIPKDRSTPPACASSVVVDDSTSETPPCASEHSPLIWVRAP